MKTHTALLFAITCLCFALVFLVSLVALDIEGTPALAFVLISGFAVLLAIITVVCALVTHFGDKNQ